MLGAAFRVENTKKRLSKVAGKWQPLEGLLSVATTTMNDVEVTAGDTVQNIKSMIQEEEGVQADTFTLMYDGCLLGDDTLWLPSTACGIPGSDKLQHQEHSTLHIIQRLVEGRGDKNACLGK
ncbi:unnamed protein product [Dovyalis caffra]|uniref:Ubiquitin-like domain-containing protein n=1 Tax=Dovyalis caffra TaxID=77055 RepID=A0AAV1QZX3_9ROSI|nr:unnamed protein product [Dovyalis caffra]